jgi:hypothetical protein
MVGLIMFAIVPFVGAIPKDKWKQHIQECVRVCASGGWIEIVESDTHVVNGGPACKQFNTWSDGGAKARGIDVHMVHHLDELMREAGLINVTKQTFIGPIGPWGGKTGELFFENYKLLNTSVQPLYTSVFGVSKEEVERNAALMEEEFKSHQTHIIIHVYLGQKQ